MELFDHVGSFLEALGLLGLVVALIHAGQLVWLADPGIAHLHLKHSTPKLIHRYKKWRDQDADLYQVGSELSKNGIPKAI
jgi:hypothetical protein